MDEITNVNLKKAVMRNLKSHVGEAEAISSESLALWLKTAGFANVPDLQRKVRDIIHDLRQEGTPICSRAGKGYFWPASLEEVEATHQYLDTIAKDQLYTAKQIKDGGIKLFGGQQGLGI
jgi:hypothetical protein